MKSFVTLILLFLVSFGAEARPLADFRCTITEGQGIKFYTKIWNEYDRMKVKYTDSYYGDGGEWEPQVDRQFQMTRQGTKLIALIPGLGADRMELVIDTASPGRLSTGKQWGSRSRVHQATFQTGDKVENAVCEVAY